MKNTLRQSIQYFVFLPLLTIVMENISAQQNKTGIAGVYFLEGVMETASVFELKPDSSFEFFFSQGALDRGGSGKWTIKDGLVVFNSMHTRPTKDYALVNSKKIPGDNTVIKMVDENTMILSYSDVYIKTPAGTLKKSTDSQGEITFTHKNATEISLLFRLCPDRASVFAVNKENNYFEFRLEPWIAEVFFDNFVLTLQRSELHGANPILEGKTFHYVERKE